MKPEALSALKREIEQNFGRKISSYRDCVQLVEDIYHKTELNVNVNTIRRFFGLVKTEYPASRSTLLIFSKYCGFNSPDDIEVLSEKKEMDSVISKEEIIHYIISLFKTPSLAVSSESLYYSFIKKTLLFLERNPDLIDKFQREVAKTINGQYYYFERSVHMDKLTSYYGDGLQYYLREKNSTDAKIFFHSIQVLKYWLTDNDEGVEKSMKELYSIASSHFQPHIAGRLFAAELLNASLNKASIEPIWHNVLQHISKYSKEQNLIDFGEPVYEALVLTGNKMEAAELITHFEGTIHFSKSYKSFRSPIKRNVLFKNSQKKAAEHLGILSNKYNHLFSLLANKGKPKTSITTLNQLIQDTGFTKFRSLLTDQSSILPR